VFPDILPRLVAELDLLRRPVKGAMPLVQGPVAQSMARAVWPWRRKFITPMAAVAGAVADHVLRHMRAAGVCRKIVVNNGGDIAFHLAPGERLLAGIVGDVSTPVLDARLEIEAGQPIRGIATSGWRGRSQSLGIADAVTVLAADAATADAAATMIANAVDCDHPAIRRVPAIAIKDDSDLGQLPVTIAVGDLPAAAIQAALEAGVSCASLALGQGLIGGACLRLKGRERVIAAAGLMLLPAPAA
jgi:ApbE superfamily uncharacterized protein (UPF0280 family)